MAARTQGEAVQAVRGGKCTPVDAGRHRDEDPVVAEEGRRCWWSSADAPRAHVQAEADRVVAERDEQRLRDVRDRGPLGDRSGHRDRALALLVHGGTSVSRHRSAERKARVSAGLGPEEHGKS
jgi:hypothetical protein